MLRRFTSKTDFNSPPEMDEPITQDFRERESWETVFQNHGLRLVFKGPAGSGKSFSLAQELRKRLSLARKELEDSRSLHELELPILVKSKCVSRLRIQEHHRSSAGNRVRNLLIPISKAGGILRSPLDRGRRLFIVIDGLDELPATSES